AIYDSIYQYDPLGDVSTLGGGPTFWGANRFVASSTTIVRAVGTYAVVPNTAYEVWMGSSTSSLTKATSGTFAEMGFHTVALPAGYPVSSGAPFVVAVKLTTPGYNYPLPFECAVGGYSSAANAAAGQSYYSFNGTSWTDLTTYDASANACIKAYASNDTTAPVTGDNAGTSWHALPFTLTLAPADAGSGMAGGRAGTEYSTDGGTTWTSGTSLAFVGWRRGGGSGTFPVQVRSTDALGNVETPHTVSVMVDSSRPTSADDAPASAQTGPVTVHLTGRDAYSGVASIWYSLDGDGWTQVAYPGGTGVAVSVPGSGLHTLLYYAVDGAGNSQLGYRVCVVPVL
ncbi:MAG TPA: lectin like domain-containing protein, partial [Thermoleophilia bacterium]|nr:lectin like domain-containing protein [Thermoleophilia bacterium]